MISSEWEQTMLPTKNRDGIIIKSYVYIKEYIDFVFEPFLYWEFNKFAEF